MNYMKSIFKNIEKLYSENRQKLLEEDGLRLSKSTPRDIISNISKFKTIYEERQIEEISKATIASDILKKDEDNDVVRTNIRTMTELKLLQIKNDDIYIFTDEFKELKNSTESICLYLINGIKTVSNLDDLNMIYNAILCILREGYLNEKILGFPDSKEKFFKAVPSKKERVGYCKMVYDIYGFRSRGKDPENPDYTPNSNYRFITTMNQLELIEKIQNNSVINEYEITEKGIDVLKQIEFNLGNLDKSDKEQSEEENEQQEKEIDYPHNRILFGAPGTGKSYTLKQDSTGLKKENIERVTFHPNYSYSQFVGTYKPKPVTVGGTDITYEYVSGPFLRQLIKAKKSIDDSKKNGTLPENYLLIIEEINRANVASVFGDIFQLLDRKDGKSEYSITTSEDMRAHLADKLGGKVEEYESIKLPSNLYIWATMNSADQGVFPMDTAFKRRWSFEYLDIDAGENIIEENIVKLGKEKRSIKWNELRKSINHKLTSLNINEDKLLGPFFLSIDEQTDEDKFERAFKNKVLMYLYEDVLRHRKSEFFKGDISTYSKLIKSYDEFGGDIFDFILNYEPEKNISDYEADQSEESAIDTETFSVAQEEDDYLAELQTNEE